MRRGSDAEPRPALLATPRRSAPRDTGRAMAQENVEIVRGVRTTLRPGGERARRRRALDERLLVRFPSLAGVVGGAFMRLSPRSRLRRLLLTRRIRQAYAAQSRRDFEAVLAGWDPACEYRPSRDLMPPDLDAAFHGHDGMLELWHYWRDAFEDIRWDPEEILDLGAKLLVTAQQRGHGSGSGVAVSESVFQLFTLRRGLVLRQEDFMERSEALAAAELRE
jgi:ketosteroid isomerase-like protein